MLEREFHNLHETYTVVVEGVWRENISAQCWLLMISNVSNQRPVAILTSINTTSTQTQLTQNFWEVKI